MGYLRSASKERVPPWWGGSACCCCGCCSSTANKGSFRVNGGTKNRACSTCRSTPFDLQAWKAWQESKGRVNISVLGQTYQGQYLGTVPVPRQWLVCCLQCVTQRCSAMPERQEQALSSGQDVRDLTPQQQSSQNHQGHNAVYCLMQA